MRVYLCMGVLCGIIGLGSAVYGLYSGIERHSIVAIVFYSCALCFNLWIFIMLIGLFKECKILRKVKEMDKQEMVIYKGVTYKKGDVFRFGGGDIETIDYFIEEGAYIGLHWKSGNDNSMDFVKRCGTKVEKDNNITESELYETIAEQQKTIDILESKIVNLKKQMEENQGPKFEIGDKVRTERGSIGFIVAYDLSENDYCVAWTIQRSMHMDWKKPHLLKLISKGEQS